jgi:hypothetical protein
MVRNGHNVSICIWYDMVIMYRQVHAAFWYHKKYVFKMGKKRTKKIYMYIMLLCIIIYSEPSNDMSLDFLSFHFLNTTFDLIAIKANGQWLVLLFVNYHLWLTVKQTWSIFMCPTHTNNNVIEEANLLPIQIQLVSEGKLKKLQRRHVRTTQRLFVMICCNFVFQCNWCFNESSIK